MAPPNCPHPRIHADSQTRGHQTVKTLATAILGAVIYAVWGGWAVIIALVIGGALFAIAAGLQELARQDRQ